jgi:lysozyme
MDQVATELAEVPPEGRQLGLAAGLKAGREKEMLGVDVSNNQGRVDWGALARDGVKFAWVKATEGRTYRDSYLTTNREGAKAAGIVVGAYHYARPDLNNALQEAENFLAVAKPMRGELLPVLDFEESKAARLGARALQDWALAWLGAVEKEVGAAPIFYTYPSYLYSTLAGAGSLRAFPLWLAAYGPNDGRQHAVQEPSGFRMVAHQFTSEGRVGGRFPLDLNYAKELGPITYKAQAPAEADEFNAKRRAALRRWILARKAEGRSWPWIKRLPSGRPRPNWREFLRRGGS